MGIHRIAADILKATQYIRPMRWIVPQYIRRYAVDDCAVYPQ
ncbi:MAG: hypothetical protein PHY48_08425 [Candidatus Cloacimonetes bacterium]|nr:hypothetical protein [Candidatus Cloacimonadota bacterium]